MLCAEYEDGGKDSCQAKIYFFANEYNFPKWTVKQQKWLVEMNKNGDNFFNNLNNKNDENAEMSNC